MTHISQDQDVITLINVFSVAPDNQERLRSPNSNSRPTNLRRSLTRFAKASQ